MDGRDARPVEDICGKTYYSIQVVLIDELLPDDALRRSAKQDAMGQDDCHRTVFTKVIETVQNKRIVGLCSRSELSVWPKAFVFQSVFVVVPRSRIWWISDYGIKGCVRIINSCNVPAKRPIIPKRIGVR